MHELNTKEATLTGGNTDAFVKCVPHTHTRNARAVSPSRRFRLQSLL